MTALVFEDARFARMLEISIARRGESVQTFRSLQSAAASAPTLIICEAALYSRRAVADGTDAVICGYSDAIATLGECEFTTYTRPFDVEQMLDEVLGSPMPDAANKKKKSASDGIILHSKERSAVFRGENVKLSKKEFALLSLLLSKRGDVVTREEAAQIFGGEGGTNVVDVYIKYLRQKLDEHFGVKIISSVRGKGYAIKAD